MQTNADDPPGGSLPAHVLAGRFRLAETLGSGGSGVVFRALDQLTGATVAVKLLSPLSTGAMMRLRREILAMRVLQVPGVVSLLDHGVDEGRPYIAMALVEGEPFPGPRFDGTWASLAPTATRLLEILARIHGTGIVHRDLKPANILVDAEGRPTVLDLGLARGKTLGTTITSGDAVLGTPRWQSPEQMIGGHVDARADLYAVGVMLFEALAGEAPHPSDDLNRLYFARVMRDAPSLAWSAPHVPAEVARLVDRLLQRQPESRHRTAAEVLAELRGAEGEVGSLPRLGPDPVPGLVADLLAGRARDVAGPQGSGRTRVLREAAQALAGAGRRVVWLVPGERPFASLQPTFPAAGADAQDARDMGRSMERSLRAALGEGTVFVADEDDRLDPWSRALLDACRADGPVLRALPEGGDPASRLPSLAEEDLRPLFAGPDRFLHLQEDGARELFARTGGNPARATEEAHAWVAAGLARWEGSRLAVDRHALERLATGLRFPSLRWDANPPPLLPPLEELLAWVALAWPHATPDLLRDVAGLSVWELEVELRELARMGAVRTLADGRVEPLRDAPALQAWADPRRRQAHARIAARVPPGAPGRLEHLIGAGDLAGTAREARVVAGDLATRGLSGRALAVLGQGLAAARDAEDRDLEAALLVDLVRVALAEQTGAGYQHALYEVERARAPAGDAGGLAQLLRAAVAWAGQGSTEAVEAALADVPAFADEDLACWRWAFRFAVALRRDLDGAEALVDEAEAWAVREGTGLARGRALGWRGLLRYRQGRFAEAAALHEAAVPLKTTVPDRLNSMLNAAGSRLEDGDLEAALRMAEAARTLARECRLPSYEARAELLSRTFGFKLGHHLAPDRDLVDAIAGLGTPALDAQACLCEAGQAWRSGDARLAGELAARAVRLYAPLGLPDASALADALALLCDDDRSRVDAAPMLALLPRCSGEAALQVLGMLALAFPDDGDPAWAEQAEALYARVPERVRHRVQEVLVPERALAYCRALARRAPG